MKDRNITGKFLNNGQSEMREFLERIKLDTDKPEERLESLSFVENEITETQSKKATNQTDKFIKYDFEEMTMQSKIT